jgi:copper(I)-binding protein
MPLRRSRHVAWIAALAVLVQALWPLLSHARLVSASSPVAGVVELHEMAMNKDVMKMRAVPGNDIPAGKGAELKPGGYHVMLMNLKSQMKEGEVVPITLIVEGKDGKRQTLEVKAPVRPLAAPATGHMKH